MTTRERITEHAQALRKLGMDDVADAVEAHVRECDELFLALAETQAMLDEVLDGARPQWDAAEVVLGEDTGEGFALVYVRVPT